MQVIPGAQPNVVYLAGSFYYHRNPSPVLVSRLLQKISYLLPNFQLLVVINVLYNCFTCIFVTKTGSVSGMYRKQRRSEFSDSTHCRPGGISDFAIGFRTVFYSTIRTIYTINMCIV